MWTTSRLLDALATALGSGATDEYVGKGGGHDAHSPLKMRALELLAHFEACETLPDLEEFASRHGVKRPTVENDALRLVEEGSIPARVLERPDVQGWLAEADRLEEAIATVWHGTGKDRLKPLMEALRPDAPDSLDYVQLKLGLLRRKCSPG